MVLDSCTNGNELIQYSCKLEVNIIRYGKVQSDKAL